jgi:hypothetical protein
MKYLSEKGTKDRYILGDSRSFSERVKPRRNEDNFQGALLLEKETLK